VLIPRVLPPGFSTSELYKRSRLRGTFRFWRHRNELDHRFELQRRRSKRLQKEKAQEAAAENATKRPENEEKRLETEATRFGEATGQARQAEKATRENKERPNSSLKQGL